MLAAVASQCPSELSRPGPKLDGAQALIWDIRVRSTGGRGFAYVSGNGSCPTTVSDWHLSGCADRRTGNDGGGGDYLAVDRRTCPLGRETISPRTSRLSTLRPASAPSAQRSLSLIHNNRKMIATSMPRKNGSRVYFRPETNCRS